MLRCEGDKSNPPETPAIIRHGPLANPDSCRLQMKRSGGLRKCLSFQDARMSFGILKAKPAGTTFARYSTRHGRTPTWLGSSSRIFVATMESFLREWGRDARDPGHARSFISHNHRRALYKFLTPLCCSESSSSSPGEEKGRTQQRAEISLTTSYV